MENIASSSSSSGASSDGPDKQFDSVEPTNRVNIHDVVGNRVIGHKIMGFVASHGSLRSASLTSKTFYRASQFHLWRYIQLPPVQDTQSDFPDGTFYESFSNELERYTRSLSVNMETAASDVFEKLCAGTQGWASTVVDQNSEWYAVKVGLDMLFQRLDETLARTPHLKAFKSRNVPRILDLIILLNARSAKSIESIDISAFDIPGRRGAVHDMIGLSLCARTNILPETQIPLANMINLGMDMTVEPKFSFPNLRALSLTDLQYDLGTPFPFVSQLVSILKASPNLEYLKLVPHNCVGRLSRREFPGFNFFFRTVKMLEALCLQYKAAGGQRLRLKTLQVSHDQVLGHSIRQHFLHHLTDWTYLEHLDFEADAELEKFSDYCDGFKMVQQAHLPNLRKLTWPNRFGWLLGAIRIQADPRLREFDAEYFGQLALRLSETNGLDWLAGIAKLWREGFPLHNDDVPVHLTVGGLVLPCRATTPDDALDFMALLNWLTPKRSFKIRMPHLTLDQNDQTSTDFIWHIEKLTELRELWLADGLPSKKAKSPEYNDAVLEGLARKFAAACQKLEYVRILNRAWDIVRRGGEPELRAYTEWEVERRLPYAFDFGALPRVV